MDEEKASLVLGAARDKCAVIASQREQTTLTLVLSRWRLPLAC